MWLSFARAVQGGINRLKHTIHIVGEIVVPKPNDSITFRFQPSGTTLVSQAVRFSVVLGAIELDDQACRHAGEVSNVGSDWNLPTKMRSRGFYTA
jgi:hypothetical protein